MSGSSTKRKRLIIVGGGWAGLAAATRAAEEANIDIVFLERAPQLGGRAYSFFDKVSGEWLDNGTHVVIGAYTRTLALLGLWGAKNDIDFTAGRAIPWIFPDGSISKLQNGGAQSKLSTVAGLLKFRGMSTWEKLKTLRLLSVVLKQGDARENRSCSFAEFLRGRGIDHRLYGGFWTALTVAVMNAPPDVVDAGIMNSALKASLSGGGLSSALGLLKQPFKYLYCDPAENYLVGKGVDVRKGENVTGLAVDASGNILGVSLKSGFIPGDNVILAVPPYDVLRILPDQMSEDSFFARFRQFEYSPILVVHIHYDSAVMSFPFGFLQDGFTQWIFSRGHKKDEGWSKISVVVSYTDVKTKFDKSEIINKIDEELRRRLSIMDTVKMLSYKIILSKRATVLLKPGTNKLRPPAKTPVQGLFLAGDWCDTALPATIESAARSGWDAADEYLMAPGDRA